jgi:hypothetical protein
VPVEGQQNTFDLIKADEPTEAGTALNREAFNSIIHSRLTGRYYTPTATRTIATQRTITANPIPSSGWLNTTLTGATSGEYTITASNSHNTEWSPHKAVDNDLKTSWTSAGYTTYGNTWWQIKLPSPIVLTSFTVTLDDLSDGGSNFVLQGSTNGTSWKDLTSQFDYNGKITSRTFSVNNSTEYTYYRIFFDPPIFLFLYCLGYNVQNKVYVYTFVILWQRIQPINLNLKVLLKKLYECKVEYSLFVAAVYCVFVFSKRNHLHRHK